MVNFPFRNLDLVHFFSGTKNPIILTSMSLSATNALPMFTMLADGAMGTSVSPGLANSIATKMESSTRLLLRRKRVFREM